MHYSSIDMAAAPTLTVTLTLLKHEQHAQLQHFSRVVCGVSGMGPRQGGVKVTRVVCVHVCRGWYLGLGVGEQS